MAQVSPFDDKISSYLHQHGANKIGVFGSYSRNEARADSDLDLMVWFNEQKSLLGIIRMERELSELLGVKIDLLTEQAVSPHLKDRIRQELKEIAI